MELSKTHKISIFAVLILLLFSGAGWKSYNYLDNFENRILPNTYLGEVNISKMDRNELQNFLQEMNDKLFSEGIVVNYQKDNKKEEFVLNPMIVVGQKGGNSISLVNTDINSEVKRLIGYKSNSTFGKIKELVQNLNKQKQHQLNTIELDKNRIISIMKDNVSSFEQQPKQAELKITSVNPVEYEISSSSPGVVYQYDQALAGIKKQWSKLRVPEVELVRKQVDPKLTKADIKQKLSNLKNILSSDININYSKNDRQYSWSLKPTEISKWLEVQQVSGTTKLALNKDSVKKYFVENIAPQVEVEAKNAKFEISTSTAKKRVTQFQPDQEGLKLDYKKNFSQINEIITKRNQNKTTSSSIKLAVTTEQPEVTTKEVNELGIEEKLGTGVSDFSGSPSNRIHNIKVGMRKLDGMIIQPGETFSAVESTKPYTRAAGYLAELVIKGEKIKPELGGGLCQIGTTLFRMAMESGMPIKERRNHSLVVQYYTDPVNGNPGTDATLYNPKPDFRFKNDTGNPILLETKMDLPNRKLYFTLWGQDDGRSKSSYTHPTVSQWFEPGKPQYRSTTNLPPGKVECQKAHRGANATFTYKRVLPNGETKERVFSSHYRPLPKICLVGVKQKCKQSDNKTPEKCNEKAVDILGSEQKKKENKTS